jgi:hypothetical protein
MTDEVMALPEHLAAAMLPEDRATRMLGIHSQKS